MARAGVRVDQATGAVVSAFSVSTDADYDANAARPGLVAFEVRLDHPALSEPSRWTADEQGTLTRRPDDPPPTPRPDTKAPLLDALDGLAGDAAVPASVRAVAQRLKEHLG